MPTFSFTVKEWDKIRPSSVKKSGVSDAMKAVLKDVPKDLKALADAKACDNAVALLDELDKAFDKAAGMIKKDDKHDAAGKLKSWKAEAKDAVKMIEAQKRKIAMAAIEKAVDERMQELLNSVLEAISGAKKLSAEVDKKLKAAQPIDVAALSKTQQEFRTVERDAKKAVTKGGFPDAIRFLEPVRKSGIDPKDVPLPALASKVKDKLGELESEVDALGEKLSEAVEAQSQIAGNDDLAKEARKLIEEYKKSHAKLKKLGAAGKTLEAQAKKAADAIKATNVADTSKLIAVVAKVHEVVHKYESQVLAESYRSRDSSGDLQSAYSKFIKKPGAGVHNEVFRDWRAAIFDVVRTCTIPASAAKNQIDRAVKVLLEMDGTTAVPAKALADQIDKDRKALGSKYGMGA